MFKKFTGGNSPEKRSAGNSAPRSTGSKLLDILGLRKAPAGMPGTVQPSASSQAPPHREGIDDPLQARVEKMLSGKDGSREADLIVNLLGTSDTASHETLADALHTRYIQLQKTPSLPNNMRSALLVRVLQTLHARGRIDEPQLLKGLTGAGRQTFYIELMDPAVVAERDPGLANLLRNSSLVETLAAATIDTARLKRRLADPDEWAGLIDLPHRMGLMPEHGFQKILADGMALADRLEAAGFLPADAAALLRARLPDLVQASRAVNRQMHRQGGDLMGQQNSSTQRPWGTG